jgi:cation diffusion facilitator family transporter
VNDTNSTRHSHDFLGDRHDRNARKTWAVLLLSACMMAAEIVAGVAFGSMALLADGFHMATHAGAMLVAVIAYRFAQRHIANPLFSFGTGKVGDLAAFGSAIFLASTAGFIAIESVQRLVAPVTIAFGEALPVAVVGLFVNLASLWLLRDEHHHHGHDHGHHHDHDHGHDDHDHDHHDHDHHEHAHHEHAHHDLNLRAAYVHVLTDAAVSVLAIVGLIAGGRLGWVWLDPVMGLVGAAVILRWSIGLARAAGAILLDQVPDAKLAAKVRQRLESSGAEIRDLHLWRLGPGHHGVVASIAHNLGHPTVHYHALLADVPSLSHVTIELHRE